MALALDPSTARMRRGVRRNGRRPSAHSGAPHDRRWPAAGHGHDDPARLAGLRLARHGGRPRALRRPRALPLRALAHGAGLLARQFRVASRRRLKHESLDRAQRLRSREMGSPHGPLHELPA